METLVYVPGNDPESLPGYGPSLAKAVWSQELVETYAAEHPEDHDMIYGTSEPEPEPDPEPAVEPEPIE